jgi:hypothetical protein
MAIRSRAILSEWSMIRSHLTTIPSLLIAVAFTTVFPGWAAAQRPGIDVAEVATAGAADRAHVARLKSDASLLQLGTATGIEERFGVPTFVWAARTAGPSRALASSFDVAPAARAHVQRLAPLYRLDASDVAAARLRSIHDTGRGGIVATFDQTVDGVEIFRDRLSLLMNRSGELVAASGYIPSRSLAGRTGARAFRIGAEAAIDAALQDFAGGSSAPSLRHDRSLPGGYESYVATASELQPVRIKKVLFHLPNELRPAWYLELIDDSDGFAYVVSAVNGEILLRQDLTASDAYAYRVWANTVSPRIPMDNPHGDGFTPHPTGLPDGSAPSFIPPNLIALQNGPISTNDPWLPPGSTETIGNNVDAYADLSAPDGFSAGDLRATTTGPNTFDRVYDTSLAPGSSTNQRMASTTSLFYITNFLHDWYYDDGFNEVSGNAQSSNYGRGGVEGDRMRAEAQDYFTTNNANMLTPADGGQPRMQMFLYNQTPIASLTLSSPAGTYPVGTASFGPTEFSLSGEIVLAADGVAPASDGCSAILNSVSGKIVLVDRGNCPFLDKVVNAQNAGAIGVIIANNVAAVPPPGIGGTSGSIVIPVLSITQELGNSLKAALGGGAVSGSMLRTVPVQRDGTLDNLIVAHEWGHYISNRLIPGGLTTNHARGLGEGYGDFHAMIMAVRAGDNFNGTYGGGMYANASYYFGGRRYPYCTNLAKNPLTFQHISDAVPLPAGPPVQLNGGPNSEVHNTGEVWCSMLWECFAALLNDSGRLTFDQARSRMKAYIVAAYKMTPTTPTLTEARDALLAVAYANDPVDHGLFCQAFAKRGAGTGAVSPDRFSADNSGVVESFACGGDLALVSASIAETPGSCDNDGYIDEGETGNVVVTIRNTGATTLNATTVTLSSPNPYVSFPSGASAPCSSTNPFGTTNVSIPVTLSGSVGPQTIDIQIGVNDPGLLNAGPRVGSIGDWGNVDEVPGVIETAEERVPSCTAQGAPLIPAYAWSRIAVNSSDHRLHAPDAGSPSDQFLVTPPIQVAGAGNFAFQFSHRYSFETASGPTYYDGGVIEISNDGGANWTDIGASASPGYGGVLFTGSGNVLSGRSAFVATSPGFPSMSAVTVNLGTAYAGQTVKIRFRLGTDAASADYGWDIDDLQILNSTNNPFVQLIGDPTPCTVAVGETLPTELAFSLAGANPVRDHARFEFALPNPGHVQIALYDVAGRRVAMLADGDYPAGRHVATWNDRAPRAGVYFAQLAAGGRQLRQRVVLIP